MTTSSPFVKLLRQLSSAQDEYRSGKFDISWDMCRGSLFFVFGQPNHAEYDDGSGTVLTGQDALTAILQNLPPHFEVSGWQKSLVRNPSLKCTVQDLQEPFTSLAGTYLEEEPRPSDAEESIVEDESGRLRPVGITLETFPILPVGQSLWTEASSSVVHLDVLIPKLPTSLIVLTGTNVRACAVVEQGLMLDALWVEPGGTHMGESAAMAIQNAQNVTLSGYRMESKDQIEALIMLWRSPVAFREMKSTWLDIERFVEDLQHDPFLDCVIAVDGPTKGYGFFTRGSLAMAYTSDDRKPTQDIDVLKSLLKQDGGKLSILRNAENMQKRDAVNEDTFHMYVEGEETGDHMDFLTELSPEVSPEETPVEPAYPAPESSATADEREHEFEENQESPATPLDNATSVEQGETSSASAASDSPAAQWGVREHDSENPSTPAWSWDASTGTDDSDTRADNTVEDDLQWSAPAPDNTPYPTETESISDVDFSQLKEDLVMIAVHWLGEDHVTNIAQSIRTCRETLEDFTQLVDMLKDSANPPFDQHVMRSMAREMHRYIAEYLSGI